MLEKIMTEPKENLHKAKQTVLGLYVTAKEAYEKWQADPEKVMIIDVRTPEEYLFVGHPTMAWNIPALDPDASVGRCQKPALDETDNGFRRSRERSGESQQYTACNLPVGRSRCHGCQRASQSRIQ